MKQLPDEARQTEIIKEIEISEAKARSMADFAISMAEKWKSRSTQSLTKEEVKS